MLGLKRERVVVSYHGGWIALRSVPDMKLGGCYDIRGSVVHTDDLSGWMFTAS